MQLHTVFMAAFLGWVAGITALLPVSCVGHLVFLAEALGFRAVPMELFLLGVQPGIVIAIGWHCRGRLKHLFRHVRHDPAQRQLALNVMVAFLPIAVFGGMFHRLVTEHLLHIWAVAATLFLGGIALVAMERWKPPAIGNGPEAVSRAQAFVIGMFQVLCLLPGVSRLAITLLAGMLLGIGRQAALEFSLLLALPTLSAASLFGLYADRLYLRADTGFLIIIGCAASTMAALATIGICTGYVARHGLRPFGWYRILIGGAMLAALFAAR